MGGPRFAIVTTEANEFLAPAHNRMPALLPPAMWASWIEPGALTSADLAIIERPAPPAWLRAQAIRGVQERHAPLSAGRQLADWAPGSRLWEPREREEASRRPAGPYVMELRRALG
jgi:hypothetical protein